MDSQQGSSLDEAAHLLQAGDVEGALRLARQAVGENPSDGRAHGLLGICHARSGDLGMGIVSLQQAVQLQPNDAAAFFNLAVALVQAQRSVEARSALERALALEPQHARARAALERLDAAPSPGGPVAPSPAVPPAGASGGPVSTPTAPPPAGVVYPTLGDPAGAPAPGLQYAPPAAAEGKAPATGRRVLRGILWGPLYGQWWTLWTIVSMFLWGGLGVQRTEPWVYVVAVIIFAVVYGFFGSLSGLIIGAANADETGGAGIAIAIGLGVMFLEMWILGDPFQLLNVFFYFITGRFVGAGLAGRIQQPVPP